MHLLAGEQRDEEEEGEAPPENVCQELEAESFESLLEARQGSFAKNYVNFIYEYHASPSIICAIEVMTV